MGPGANNGAGTFVPAKGPDGQPVPPKQGPAPHESTPRVAEGTPPGTSRSSDGEWWHVPVKALANGTMVPDTSRMPQRAPGMPGPEAKVEVIDGVPHTYDSKTRTLTPIAGYVKPPCSAPTPGGRATPPPTGADLEARGRPAGHGPDGDRQRHGLPPGRERAAHRRPGGAPAPGREVRRGGGLPGAGGPGHQRRHPGGPLHPRAAGPPGRDVASWGWRRRGPTCRGPPPCRTPWRSTSARCS